MPPTRSVSPLSAEEPFSSPLIQEREGLAQSLVFPRSNDEFDHRQSPDAGVSVRTLNRGGNDGSREQFGNTEKPTFRRVKAGPGTFAADFFTLGVPIGLLIFLILVISKNGKEASESEIAGWKNAASILSTLFPLLFAAVVGRLMVQAARWRLEEGATLGSLEQLLGSRTVGGAILTQFHLKAFNFLAFAILLLWAVSPVGSQAILRLVEPKASTGVRGGGALYWDTFLSAPSDNIDHVVGASVDEVNSEIQLRDSMYGAMIMAPSSIKDSNVDLWDNVKIPRLTNEDGNNDWRDISSSNQSYYSSLLGLPVANISAGNSTFTIESNYVDLDCGNVQLWGDSSQGQFNQTITKETDRGYLNASYFGGSGMRISAPPNGTFQGYGVGCGTTTRKAAWSIGVDRLVDVGWLYTPTWSENKTTEERAKKIATNLGLFEDEPGVEAGATRLLFQAYVADRATAGHTDYVAAYCNIHQKYAESRVLCTKRSEADQQNCTVIAQRPSQKYKITSNITLLNYPKTIMAISQYWPLASGSDVATVGLRDITLQYLGDPYMSKIVDGGLKLQNLTSEQMGTRLSQALNTYMELTTMNWAALNLKRGSEASLDKNQTSEVQVEHDITIFQIPAVWTGLAIACCAVLIAGGVASIVFAHLSNGPEILGFVNTALRRNNIDMPVGNATMSGMGMAEELKNTRVRYGVSELDGDGLPGLGYEKSTAKIKDVAS